MLKIKNTINQFTETRQHLKLLSVFFLSTLLFKILILYVQIFYKAPYWNYNTLSPNFYLIYDTYWSDIVKIFLTIALLSFFTFLILHIKKINNKKYIFLFLSLLCLNYTYKGFILFPIFESGLAPSNADILLTVFAVLFISYLFYDQMNKLKIFDSKQSNETYLKKYIVRYWPLYFSIYVFLSYLMVADYKLMSLVIALPDIFFFLGIFLVIIIWHLDSKILKFLVVKKYFMQRIWIILFMPFVYIIHLYLFPFIASIIDYLSLSFF